MGRRVNGLTSKDHGYSSVKIVWLNNCGFAARCEARLCLAVSLRKRFGAAPPVRALPKLSRPKPYRGLSPKLWELLTARRSLASHRAAKPQVRGSTRLVFLVQREAPQGVFADAAQVEVAVAFDNVGDFGEAVGGAVLEVFHYPAALVQTQDE